MLDNLYYDVGAISTRTRRSRKNLLKSFGMTDESVVDTVKSGNTPTLGKIISLLFEKTKASV